MMTVSVAAKARIRPTSPIGKPVAGSDVGVASGVATGVASGVATGVASGVATGVASGVAAGGVLLFEV